jgi:hypothetical protein
MGEARYDHFLQTLSHMHTRGRDHTRACVKQIRVLEANSRATSSVWYGQHEK